MGLAGLGVFIAATDQTLVVAVLPDMIESVGLFQDQFYRAAWIVNAYILGYVVAMPLMARVADSYGHGRVFTASLVVFITGSAWVALSNDLTMLSIARAFQAAGGGALVPVAMAIVVDAVPVERRALGLGAIAAVAEAGGLIGPLWGGGLASLIDWRWLFWLNLPLCIPIAIGVWRLSGRQNAARAGPIDVTGGALLGVTLVFLTVALTNDPVEPRTGLLTAGLFLGAALSLLAFLGRELRARQPIVDLALFRRVPLSAGLATNTLVGGALIVAMVTLPLFTNVILNGSALEGGLNLMRMTVALPFGAVAGGAIVPALGHRRTAVAGLLLTGAGFLGMSRWDSDPGVLLMTLPLLTAGFGFGLVIAPIGTAVIGEVGQGERATISSLLTVVRLMGALVGVALLTTRGLHGFYVEAGLVPLDDPRYVDVVKGLEVDSFQTTFLVTALVCFGATLPALLLGKGEPPASGGLS